jgi:2-polyprenyl-3-methyl-5-hydroxy-6-metoxy-1,4-benzoquinol methylase
LGCAAGQVGRLLLANNQVEELVGIEIFQSVADEAAKYYDKVIVGDIESLNLEYAEYFDFIICGDILEHLSDPWAQVKKMKSWLRDEGIIISSIPNVRHWQVLLNLVFKGEWEYKPEGILDRTHLRFFTQRTALDLFLDSGFKIFHYQMWVKGFKKSIFNQITFHLFEGFLAEQTIVVAKKGKN